MNNSQFDVEMSRLEANPPPCTECRLGFPAPALASVVSDRHNVSFLVGTAASQVIKITVDNQNLQLHYNPFLFTRGSVCGIDSSPSDQDLFLSTYRNEQTGLMSAAIMELQWTMAGLGRDVRVVMELDSIINGRKEISAMWHPSDNSRLLCLQGDSVMMVDIAQAAPRVLWLNEQFVWGERRLETGRWNPHRSYHQLATVMGSQVMGWDTRMGTHAWSLTPHTSTMIHSLDFNPNKEDHMLTGGEDGCINIWDIRYQNRSIHSSRHHRHEVKSVRYNPDFDQLLLSAGVSGRAVMESKATEPVVSHQTPEGLVAMWPDQRDTVHMAEWSAADPWTFASLSCGGSLIIGQVPRHIRLSLTA